ncbi:hypothetical protein [Leptolyngbya sp. 7M]|uniref:hypothetical protein n=1 Tax=Leptolyngbya sp. 7M TaxID=2812896 RepID=UPI001B8DA636|nr:hypothetical protein [Leptolyngbya sp. 7M]QYO62898.1 hypothetical protein JVX88_23185 [Leptolyngbya sp. 7M]
MSFWYPTPNSWYFARGADHAPMRLRVTSPSGLRVVSTGSESSGVFDQKLLVQPFFAAGKWQEENAAGVSVLAPVGTDAEGKKRASELAQLAADAVAFYSEMFGSKPNTPLRIVTVGRGSGYHSGGTMLIDSSTLARPKIDSLTAMNIAEGVAKLWIGDSVNVSGDGYGVVREGLPRHFANQFIEHKFGRDIADMERTRQRIAYSAVSRRDEPLNLVAPLDDYYFAAVANKGAMVWRLLQRKVGQREFLNALKESMRSGSVTLADLRAAFPGQKEFLDKMLDERTEGNLLVGLPRQADGQYSVAVRNTGSGDVTVDVRAFLANGETMSAPVTIRATSFGEVNFRTTSRIERVEIDPEKLYPQIDYSDDIAPRETTDSDLLLAVKRDFDRQAFAEAEKTARTVLRWEPRFDDVRVLLARSLLAQNRLLDAEREFNSVLAEKLPGARSMAWAAAGLADVLSRTGRNDEALRYVSDAIRAEGEYGASLLARNVRNRLNRPFAGEDSIRAYFTQFDRAAISNRKAEIDALILSGEIARFASGISGNAVEWKSDLKHADVLDADTVLVEAAMSVRLLNREIETGMAVYRLVRTGGGWRMSAVEIFEVR